MSDVAVRSFNVLSLCSGVGGLELGLRLAVPAARTVCYVEGEVAAAALLVARVADGALDEAPVWDDVRTFDTGPWRGVVDCVTAGYPCQPFSVAGRQRGESDPRHLWPHVARVVAGARPRAVFLENVAHHLRGGFATVHDDLRGLGYRVAAGLFSAREVGAPHLRNRLFVLAVADGDGGVAAERGAAAEASVRGEHAAGEDGRRAAQPQRAGGAVRGRNGRAGAAVADGVGERPQGVEPAGPAAGPAGRGGGAAVVDLGSDGTAGRRVSGDLPESPAATEGQARQRQRLRDAADCAGGRTGECSVPLFPPGPGDLDAWRAVLASRPDLAPAVVPGVHRVADGLAHRVDRLRVCGNGVVPLAAGYAFCVLAAALGVEVDGGLGE